MPDIFFKCPECHGHLVVDSRGVGMQLPCPFCERQVRIPAESDAEELQRREQKKSPAEVLAQTAAESGLTAANGANGDHDPHHDEPRNDGLGKRHELQRLAAMMRPDEAVLAPGALAKKGVVALRCPSCGKIVASRISDLGADAECGSCGAAFRTPEANRVTGSQKPGKPSRGKLPERRSEALRTADDLRKARVEEVGLDAASSFDLQFQDLIRRELEKLTNNHLEVTAPVAVNARKRKPPPLANHGEVVAPRGDVPAPTPRVEEAPTESRRVRIAPKGQDLPPLVALESMELESEVAKQWGPDAVINTRRLHWMAILVGLLSLGALGWWGYEKAQTALREQPEKEKASTVPEPESVNAKAEKAAQGPILELLKGFHQATTSAAKARFVRHGEALLPVMEKYYEEDKHPLERRNFTSPKVTRQDLENREFYLAEADYTEGLEPLRVHVEKTPDGRYLLDWKSLVGYGELGILEFCEKTVREPTEFRMTAERTAYYKGNYSDPAKHESFALRDKDGDLLYGYSVRESETGKRLTELFKKLEDEGKKRAELTVRLRFEPNAEQKFRQVLIDRIVAETWVELAN